MTNSGIDARCKSDYPIVMGIININHESFYAASRISGSDDFISRFTGMLNDGASIIDIGACSTKPGSTPVSEIQEAEYLMPQLKALAGRWDEIKERLPEDKRVVPNIGKLISIDTFRNEIVKMVYDLIGPFTVNDISAGEDDRGMLDCVGKLGLPYVAMHKRGTPSTMQTLCEYSQGVVTEVINYFKDFEKRAQDAGITEWIVDPGFGFAKTIKQNYEMMARLDEFKSFGRPVLVGISRKSMIWKLLATTPEETLPQTTALNLLALTKGADIIRVHDVREGVSCLKMFEQLSL